MFANELLAIIKFELDFAGAAPIASAAAITN